MEPKPRYERWGRPAQRSRAALLLVWLCCGAAWTAWAQEPATAPALPDSVSVPGEDARPIGSILVEGNRTADAALILRSSGLKVGEPAGDQKMRRAIQSLYGMGLFSSINVVERPDSAGLRRLTIEVTENPRIASLEWSGNRKIGAEDLRAEIDLRPGQLLDRRKIYEAQKALETMYQDQGFASATVIPRITAPSDGKVDIRFEIEEGRKFRVHKVHFRGNEAFGGGDLRDQVKLKPKRIFKDKPYSAAGVREDRAKLEDYYRNTGYMDVAVSILDPEFDDERGRVELTYLVEEGGLYRFGRMTWDGNTAVPTEALELIEEARPGDPFSQAKLQGTTAGAYELYTEKGYLLELMIVPETRASADTVHINFRISEGEPSHVREVEIVGNTRTREYVIRREMTLFPGQLLRRSTLLRSQRDIFALGFFEDVQIDYQPAGIGSDVNVTFRVKEKSSGTATAGAAYSSDTGLTGFVEFGHNNLFGKGQAVNVHLERGSQRETFDISFTEPWMLGTPTSAGFHVYNMVRQYDLYTQKQKGGGINLGRPWFFRVPDFTRVYLGYSIEDLEYTDLGDLDPTSQEILRASSGTASRLSLSFSRNSTDNPFHPTLGSRTSGRLELAGGLLGGDLDYYKTILDHRIYFVPFGKPTLMIRNRMSYLGAYDAGDPLPGSETFRLGGTRSDYLRGYPDYEIIPEENIHYASDGSEVRFPGGKLAYTFTAEYGFPVVNPVWGLLFMDAGNSWNSSRDVHLSSLYWGFGAGIRLEIPMLGPVGFDYAWGQYREKWRAHFIIGPAF